MRACARRSPAQMKDPECVALLQWALPHLGLRWPRFRRFRRQVCKRVGRRLRELGISDAAGYRGHLETHPEEWEPLAALCTVSVSRFYRDRGVFDDLTARVLPELAQAALARGAKQIECWCAGCASGEEAYTLALLWRIALQARFSGLDIRVLGTDIDSALLARAREACYQPSSLKELPADWRAQGFEKQGALFCLRELFRRDVAFARQDLRSELPEGLHDLIFCRNLAFIYFEAAIADETLDRLLSRLRPGGALVVGLHDRPPVRAPALVPWPGCRAAYRFERPPISS